MQHPVGIRRCDATAWRARKQPLLNQVGLVDFFERVGLFAHCRTDGTEADRTTAKLVNRHCQNLAVGRVQPFAVDAEHVERLEGGAFVNDACTADLRYVTAAPEHAIRYARRASASSAEDFSRVLGEADA